MSEKKKLIVLKICNIVLKAVMAVLQALEKPEYVDKSVLDVEIDVPAKTATK